MLSKQMNDKLNTQITWEFASSYLYRQMGSWLNGRGLTVLEGWFLRQAGEELLHAMKLIDYVQKAGGNLRLGAIEAPQASYESPVALLEKTLEHERGVTARIHALAAQADADKDYSTRSYLQWYIDEQVEEESSVQDLVNLARMAGDQWLLFEDRVDKIVAARDAAAAAKPGA
jgi:ferritin